jgi:hypothetical protein
LLFSDALECLLSAYQPELDFLNPRQTHVFVLVPVFYLTVIFLFLFSRCSGFSQILGDI